MKRHTTSCGHWSQVHTPVKEFIEEYIGEEKKIKPYTRIKHLLGIAESGVADLGQSHREHLIKKLKANINERNSGYRPWVALIDRSESMHDRFLRN